MASSWRAFKNLYSQTNQKQPSAEMQQQLKKSSQQARFPPYLFRENQTCTELRSTISRHLCRTPQSAHHDHQSHDEHRQRNPAGGVHFAFLLGSDNSYTTPFEIPFLIRCSSWWRYIQRRQKYPNPFPEAKLKPKTKTTFSRN